MNSEHDEIEEMLSSHLRRRLDAQVGRASAEFKKARLDRPRVSSRRWMMGAVAGASGLMAAAVMLAWPLHPTQSLPPQRLRVASSPVQPATASPATSAPVRADEVDLHRLVAWRAIDEGAGVIDDTIPVRRVRYEAVEQIEWSDPVDEATIQLYVPVAQVLLVQQPSL